MSTTTVFQAAREGDLSALESWIRHTENYNLTDSHGFTVLHWVCRNNHVDVLELMISFCKLGMDVEKRAQSGDTALLLASQFGNARVVSLLIDALGADPDAVNAFGNSGLHYATIRRNKELSEILIKNGCRLARVNAEGLRASALRPDHDTDFTLSLETMAKDLGQDLTEDIHADLSAFETRFVGAGFGRDTNEHPRASGVVEVTVTPSEVINNSLSGVFEKLEPEDIDILADESTIETANRVVETFMGTGYFGKVTAYEKFNMKHPVQVLVTFTSAPLYARMGMDTFNDEITGMQRATQRHVSKVWKVFSEHRLLPIVEVCGIGSVPLRHIVQQDPQEAKIGGEFVTVHGATELGITLCGAIQHMHSLSQPVVHMNLNAETVYVDHHGMPVISLGSALFKHTAEAQLMVEKAQFLAPEVLRGDALGGVLNKDNAPADIYGLGIILWQALHRGKDPYPDLNATEIGWEVILKGLRPEIDEERCPRNFARLLKLTWNAQGERRPSIDQILQVLEKL
eukprot:Clim_evm5s14 gene=Clim_evmTU5s14